jgi:hypothetical protein
MPSQLFVVVFELKEETRSVEDFTDAIVNSVYEWSQVSVVLVKPLPSDALSASKRRKPR